jgi:O-antigen/teichoic acid export membrane protein
MIEDPDVDVLDSSAAAPRSIRGGVVRTAGYVGGLALAIISAPLIIRHLGIADYGRYVTVLSVVTVATGVTEGGLVTLAIREYSTTGGAARLELMRTLLGLRLALSVAGVAVAVAFSAIAGYEDALVIGTLIAGAGFLATSVQLLAAVPLQASLRNGAVTLLELARQALTVAMIVAGTLAGAGVLAFLTVPLLAALPVLLATLWLIRGRFPLVPALHPDRWRPLLAATVPFAAVSVIAVIYFRVGIVTLSVISTEEETGYFATAFRVLEAFVGVPNVVVAAVFPILARAGHTDLERFRYAMERVLYVCIAGGAGLALSVALGSEFIVQVLAGDAGEPAVPILRTLSLALLASFLGSAAGYGLLSLRRQVAVVIAIGLGLVTNLCLILLLAPAHGAEGAAVAMTAGEGMIAISMMVMLGRSGPGSLPSLRGLLPVACGLAAGGAVALTGIHSALQAAIGGIVYAAVLAALGGIPRDLVQALSRRDAQPGRF